MALIKCPKCGKEISDKAKKCPGCGWEMGQDVNEKSSFIPSEDTKVDEKKMQNGKPKTHEIPVKGMNKIQMGICVAVAAVIIMLVWQNMRLNKLVMQSLNNNQTSSEDVESQNVLDETVVTADSSEESKIESESDQGESPEKDVVEDKKQEQDETAEKVTTEEAVTVTEYSDIKVDFTKTEKSGNDYLCLFFLVTNNSDSIANIHTSNYHYINGVSVRQAYSDMLNEIAPKKSAQLKVVYRIDELSIVGDAIDTVGLQLVLKNENDKTPFELLFKGLNIDL